jgi:hypothetical protein
MLSGSIDPRSAYDTSSQIRVRSCLGGDATDASARRYSASKSRSSSVHCAPSDPGINLWPYLIRANLRLRRLRSPSSVPRRLAHSPISTEVKSTEALPGERALTALRTAGANAGDSVMPGDRL